MNENAHKCQFCGKEFKFRGSYGRHLDSKKGDELHPAEEIEKVRSNVIRRGDKRSTPENTDESRKKRKEASKAYNDKDSVRAKNIARRKSRDQRIKARLQACDWFLDSISGPQPTPNSSFPYLVATRLGASHWPSFGTAPDGKVFNMLLGQLEGGDLDTLYEAYKEWNLKSESQKLEAWHTELWSAMKEHLQGTSLWQLRNARALVDEKQKEIYDRLGEDVFELLVSGSEGG